MKPILKNQKTESSETAEKKDKGPSIGLWACVNTTLVLGIAISTSLLLLSCTYKTSKNASANDPGGNGKFTTEKPKAEGIDFAYIKTNILSKYCTECHGNALQKAGKNYESYAAVFADLSAIKTEIEPGDMPPPDKRAPLPTEAKALLLQWITCGGPELPNGCQLPGGGNPPSNPPTLPPSKPPGGNPPTDPTNPPTQPIPPKDMELSYDLIHTQVISKNCLSCHGAPNTQPDGDVSLTTFAEVKSHLTDISTDIASGRMPRKKTLPTELKTLIQAWIDCGAPEAVTTCQVKTPPTPGPGPTPPPTVPPGNGDDDCMNKKIALTHGGSGSGSGHDGGGDHSGGGNHGGDDDTCDK